MTDHLQPQPAGNGVISAGNLSGSGVALAIGALGLGWLITRGRR